MTHALVRNCAPAFAGDDSHLLAPYKIAVLPLCLGLPWYALLSDVEFSGERLRQIIPGRWTVVGRNRDITLYRYEGKGK